MDNEKHSKLNKWREKNGSFVIAFICLIGLIIGWGNNWFLTGVLGLGVLVNGTYGFFDLKRATYNKNK